MPETALTIDELAARAGVTVRTVRFYGARGLLPPPDIGPRRVGRYGSAHLSRLALIEELQHQGLTLAAIERYLQQPEGKARFVVQWTNDFAAANGETKSIPPSLRQHPRVEIVDRLFRDGEYLQRLARTDALLLPYRRSAYSLRVSRMMVEAVVRGLPVLTTQHTTLHEQMLSFGAGIDCREDDVASVAAAIAEIERRFPALQSAARARREAARDHFSVRTFRSLLQSTLSRP